ncbi:MAG: tripartite tricarboxylate transporter permease, partial [Nitrososphaerales archaeon]
VKVTKVPGPLLVPFIFSLTVFAPYVANISFFNVMEVLVFGAIGFIFRRLRYPLGSFVIGLVLGPTFETNVYLTHNVYKGFSFLLERPLADVLFALAIGVLILKTVQMYSENRHDREVLQEELSGLVDPAERARAIRAQRLKRAPYPLLNLLTTIGLLGVSIPWTIYGIEKYNFATGILPVIAGLLVILPALYRLPRNAYVYLASRNLAPEAFGAPPAVATPPGADADSWNGAGEPSLVRELVSVGSSLPPSTEAVAEHGGVLVSAAELAEVSVATTTPQFNDKSWGWRGQYSREACAFVWLCGLVGLCYVVGFVWGLPIFMAVYGLVCAKRFFASVRGWLIYIVISAAVMWFVAYEMTNLMHLVFTPLIDL